MKFATINFEGVAEPIVALEEKEPRLLKDVCKTLNTPKFSCLENFISENTEDLIDEVINQKDTSNQIVLNN